MKTVPPTGPIPSKWAILGERPGRQEAAIGKPFVGESGAELWGALRRYGGYARDQFYVTNVLQSYSETNKPPTPAEIAEALPGLLAELDRVRPEVLVAVGGTACAALGFTRPLADIHGIVHPMTIAGRLMLVYPMLHPAAMLHSPNLASTFHWDVRRLGTYVLPRIPLPNPAAETPLFWTPYRGVLVSSTETIAVDTEGWPDRPWGFSAAWASESAVAHGPLPFRQQVAFTRQLARRTLIMHNGAGDLQVLAALGIHHQGPWIDTQVLAYHDIVRTGSGSLTLESQGLKTLAYRELGLELMELKDIPGVDLKLRFLPQSSQMNAYARQDAIATHGLYVVYLNRGLVEDALVRRDMAALPYVAAMETAGVPVDRTDVATLHDRLLRKEGLIQRRLDRRAQKRLGVTAFNPRSTVQVRGLLKAYGVKPKGRTKGGEMSTSEKALSMAAEHPVVRLIQGAREVSKLKGTYVEPLLYDITEAGRLHPRFASTRILTGRLATKGFPLLGVPKHSKEGKKVRKAIKAPPGFSIYRADLSQVELRIAAHLSQDVRLLAAYHQNRDIHAYVAHRVFGAPEDKKLQDESKHRLPSKALNFGYWMGISIKGLTEQIRKAGNRDWSKDCLGCERHNMEHREDCDSQRLMESFEAEFPGARIYQQARIAHLHKTGMAYGLWGEQWYLPAVWSGRDDLREGAERQSFAVPIQSGNARLLKGAMATLSDAGFPEGIEPIVQVHDELVFLVPTADVEAWHQVVIAAMEGAASLSVPIKAEGSFGPDWATQQPL